MKAIYNNPELNVQYFKAEEILTSSAGTSGKIDAVKLGEAALKSFGATNVGALSITEY